MGPRPDGRGKPLPPTYPWARRAGVNGAAARRPRKERHGRGGARPTQSVNGAAARRPRKDARAERREWQGIASMGPRPDGRGKPPTRRTKRRGPRVNGAAARRPRKAAVVPDSHCLAGARQWGRGQTAAERRSSCVSIDTQLSRQWGRGQTAAESRAQARPRGLKAQRQWGRGQTAAESRIS